VSYKARQEIVLDQNFAEVWRNEITGVMEEVADRLDGAMPDATVVIRSADNNEQDNIEAALDSDEYMSLGRYMYTQRSDREHYGVGDTATALVTFRPLKVKNNGVWISDMYGYEQPGFDEAVISVDRYIRETGRSLKGLARVHQVAAAAGFTTQHELGHINGLVAPDRRRHTVGRHCGNLCIMQSVARMENIAAFQSRLKKTCFCPECLSDLEH
jgi:predicted Zn-dependent protease